MSGFTSDNDAGAHPKVLEAVLAANAGPALAYGDDPWTPRAARRFGELFEADVQVFFTFGGTGANVVSLHSLLAPYEAVICPSTAHINVDECGAPERITGAKLIATPSSDGKLDLDAARDVLLASKGEHHAQPRILSISQPTELGTVYTVDEMARIGEFAREHDLLVHVDGARIANAVASLECPLRAVTIDAGVDVLTFGGTKNGLMYGEAVVFLRPQSGRAAAFARKQAGQLPSKMRFIAAQFEALLTDDLWLENARQANGMARLLAERLTGAEGVEVLRPPAANSLFARLPAPALAEFQDCVWESASRMVRWMTSFATTAADVERFAAEIRSVAGRRARA
jgi:threonine aldolase